MKRKIFEVNYLINEELTDEDLHYLLDTSSLKYSLIYAMFKLAGYNFSNDKINNIIVNKNWQYKYYWNSLKYKKFRDELKDIYENLYCIGDVKAYSKADEFLLFYGLTNSKMKRNKKYQTLED